MAMHDWLNNYAAELTRVVAALPMAEVEQVARRLLRARDEGRTIFICGNGGSAATASHFAVDLGKGASLGRPRRFRVLSLCDNSPLLTALGNDVGFENAFVEQLINVAQPGDVLIAISVSGNSPNLVRAMEWAREQGVTMVGLGSRRGGRLAELADHLVTVDDEHFGRVEDAHLIICHLLAFGFIEDAARSQ
jgi:D-sedoheptulose 7-phosphate isomerase